MLNRFKRTIEPWGKTGAHIRMKKDEIGAEFYVFTYSELKLIIGRNLE